MQQGWPTTIVITPGAVPVLSRLDAASQLAVVPIDQSGTVRLNPELRERMRIEMTVQPPTTGFKIDPARGPVPLAYLVTLAGSDDVGQTIARNIQALLTTGEIGAYRRIWLPLMGIEGGGLSRKDSLGIILTAIEASGFGAVNASSADDRVGQQFVVATAGDITRDELVQLRAQVEEARGGKPLDVKGALAQARVVADDQTVAVLNFADRLMFRQKPALDNGRISTRLVLLALLETGASLETDASNERVGELVSSGAFPTRQPITQALFRAWRRLGPQALAAAYAMFFKFSRQISTEVALPPVIFSRDLAEALHVATGPARSTVGLLNLTEALLEQALRDPPNETSARRVLDEVRISPGALRAAFEEELTKAEIELPKENPSDPLEPRRDFYARFFADNPDTDSDALRARAEAVALARMAAHKTTPTPLAIGIFGDWGAGKTSFMDTIYKVVEDDLRGGSYYAKIVQIRFNAWHFIETNLWASLVSHIFAELDRTLRSDIGESVDALYRQLATARHVEVEAARQVIATKQALDQARADAERARAARTRTAPLSIGSLARESFKTFYEHLGEKEKASLDGAVKGLGIAEAKEAWEKAADVMSQTQSLVGRARLVFGAMRQSWRTGDRAPLIWAVMLLLALVLAVFLGKRIADWLGPGLGVVGGIGTAALGITTALSRLPSLAGGVLGLFERAYRSREEAARAAMAAAEKEIADHQARLAEAAAVFRTATPLGRLTRFVQEKVAGEVYQKHLGLVAMVRGDFEVLSRCIKDGTSVATAADITPAEKAALKQARIILADSGESVAGEHGAVKDDAAKIDQKLEPYGRIILYIDDLDRCTTDKVVEVLQAVHLLLAFPLFVVVVAVDYRWIRGALQRSYGSQLQAADGTGEAATAADYLEKIFQIPYWVRRLDPDTSKDFLADLILKANEQETSPSQTAELKTEERSAATAPSASSDEGLVEPVTPNVIPPKPTDARAHGARPRRLLDRLLVLFRENSQQALRPTDKGNADVATEGAVPQIHPDVAPAQMPATPETTVIKLSEAGPPERVVLAPIELTEEEEKLIVALAPHAGRTPRQLKRFFNVYRVIKAAANGNQLPIRSVLALLAIATRAPAEFRKLTQALRREKDLTGLKQSLQPPGSARDKDGNACFATFAAVDWAVEFNDLKKQAPIVARFSFCEQDCSESQPSSGNEAEPAPWTSAREAVAPPSGAAVSAAA